MENKSQHYVPRSYLKAWCDPETPESQAPYVWMFLKDGTGVRKKSPSNIFCETDFYTIRTADGERDLTLESNLCRLEGEFANLRESKLNKRHRLSPKEEFLLCAFVTAQYARTKAYKAHWSPQWQKALDLCENMQELMDASSPEERRRINSALSAGEVNKDDSMTMDDVRKMVDEPIQHSLSSIVEGITPQLFRVPFLILLAPENLEFITSDAPSVWFDQTGSGGLSSPDIEITLPLSPTQMVIFGKKLITRGMYVPAQDKALIENLNLRTRIHAHEHFIFNSDKLRAGWF